MTALERLEAWAALRDVSLHSVQVCRGGEPIVVRSARPHGLDAPHRMYSVTKSLVGLAIGVLSAERGVDLDTPLVSHFPDFAPFHPWTAATTIRDALTMRGPHQTTTYKHYDGPWLESYFRVPPTHPPGTTFTYDTSGSYTLAALVERVSGERIDGYLRSRLLDPIGASRGLHVRLGPDGHSDGGSGLVCTPDDLRRLAEVVMNDGVHDGVELVPADFIRASITAWADTSRQGWGEQLAHHYGYQVWLPRVGGWLMFGMGGQLVYGDPGRDLTIIITADTLARPRADQHLVDLVLGRLADEWLSETE